MIKLQLCDIAFLPSSIAKPHFSEVNLCLSPGIYGLFGPNGSGKTTLLQGIAGIKFFSHGSCRVTWNGNLLSGKPLLSTMGYVSQEMAFYEEMRVGNFLRYVGEMKLLSATRLKSKMNELLAYFGLAEVREWKIHDLSTGQKRKLAIAQALLNEPRLLLLDEPLDGLDLAERTRVMEYLHLQAKQSIVLLASHLASEIEHWLEQILFITEGKVHGPKSLLQWRLFMEQQSNRQSCLSLEDIYLDFVHLMSSGVS